MFIERDREREWREDIKRRRRRRRRRRLGVNKGRACNAKSSGSYGS